MGRLAAALALSAVLLSCGRDREAAQRPKLASDRLGESAPDERAPSWATEAGKSLAKGMQLGAADRVQPAPAPDRAYESNEPVAVRRVVYRFAIDLPAVLREPHPPLLPSRGELQIDVTDDRLRARFLGSTWPVDEGSELRMRVDVPGVYLFDGQGGRPLPKNHLASWFLGDEIPPFRRTPLTIRRDPGPSVEGPAELVCALLAEWTASPHEDTARQCSGGALPLGFRFGIWAADLTAIVPMSLPRSALRADAGNPPRTLVSAHQRSLLDAHEISKLAPLPARKNPDLPPPPSGPPGSGVLRVSNPGATRALVVVAGVPIGWLQPGAAGEFGGFNPGYYRLAWIRPYGDYRALPAPFAIPGELALGVTPLPAQLDLPPRSSDSPEAAR